MTIKEILKQKKNTSLLGVDAEILLCHSLNLNRAGLILYADKKLSENQIKIFDDYCRRRCAGEPIAYILGEKEFWSLMLKVSPDTLIPRPETELLVETVQEVFKSLEAENAQNFEFLELGTGSGAISLALSKLYPNSIITATDISEKALALAKENQQKHACFNINFIDSDWFKNLSDKKNAYHAIISNPPYIAYNDAHLKQGDLRFEPLLALSPGETGLESFVNIISHARHYLKPKGWIFLEHGFDQARAIHDIFLSYGFKKIYLKKDLNHLPRVTFACLSGINSLF